MIKLNFKSALLASVILLILIAPLFSSAALINCGNYISTGVEIGTSAGECGLSDLIDTFDNFIKWIISIAGAIFMIALIYGGFLYMTSGENPANKTKAISILTNTLYGLVFILCAWLIIYTIINYLVDPDMKGVLLKYLK